MSRRTALKAAAWSVPVVAAAAAVPLAAASDAAELTAWFVVTCGGRDRLTLFITNHTSESLQVFADVDMDGDGVFEAGDGPIVSAGATESFGYGLYPNGTPTYRVSTARAVYLQEQLVVDCPPIGLTSQTMLGAVGETSTPVTLTLRNETSGTMQVYVDLDFDDDGITDSTERPILAPFEERTIVYDITATHIGIDVRNDLGYSETTRISWAN
ncbi:hypothetical protein [Microbacterium sp. NPDC087591]|uniref:hypothetical protein n=1 Tax=Microbacterium sp. NPDC087591 TaxID=3364192 RepID=UPI0037F7DAFD